MVVAAVIITSTGIFAEAVPVRRAVLPDAVVDLRTPEGAARVKAQWRYSDTRIKEIDHRSVGADLKASGPRNRTFDFSPDARAADFDDANWELIPASAPGQDAIDGVKVDEHGNVYVSGPGGLWILDATGRHLGTLRGPEHPHNMAWGDADGRTLYLCAQTGIHRLRLNVAGAGAFSNPISTAKN